VGFSVSGATAVVLVGLLVSAGTLYPALDRAGERRTAAVDAAEERALDRRNTAVAATAATYHPSNDTLRIVVANVGAHTLAVDAVDLLVDGAYAGFDSRVEGDASTAVWAPGESLAVTRTETTAPGRVKVVTGPGVAVTATVEVA
jgi:flagellar protein FlaF